MADAAQNLSNYLCTSSAEIASYVPEPVNPPPAPVRKSKASQKNITLKFVGKGRRVGTIHKSKYEENADTTGAGPVNTRGGASKVHIALAAEKHAACSTFVASPALASSEPARKENITPAVTLPGSNVLGNSRSSSKPVCSGRPGKRGGQALLDLKKDKAMGASRARLQQAYEKRNGDTSNVFAVFNTTTLPKSDSGHALASNSMSVLPYRAKKVIDTPPASECGADDRAGQNLGKGMAWDTYIDLLLTPPESESGTNDQVAQDMTWDAEWIDVKYPSPPAVIVESVVTQTISSKPFQHIQMEPEIGQKTCQFFLGIKGCKKSLCPYFHDYPARQKIRNERKSAKMKKRLNLVDQKAGRSAHPVGGYLDTMEDTQVTVVPTTSVNYIQSAQAAAVPTDNTEYPVKVMTSYADITSTGIVAATKPLPAPKSVERKRPWDADDLKIAFYMNLRRTTRNMFMKPYTKEGVLHAIPPRLLRSDWEKQAPQEVPHFTLFSQLPGELQNKVWRIAFDNIESQNCRIKLIQFDDIRSEKDCYSGKKFISTTPVPGLLHACHASRSFAPEFYHRTFNTADYYGLIPFNFTKDRVMFHSKGAEDFHSMVKFMGIDIRRILHLSLPLRDFLKSDKDQFQRYISKFKRLQALKFVVGDSVRDEKYFKSQEVLNGIKWNVRKGFEARWKGVEKRGPPKVRLDVVNAALALKWELAEACW